MTSAPQTASPGTSVGFAVGVPPSWFEIDVAPATRNASIAALVEQRVKEVPGLREHRSTITRVLRRSARDAFEAGAAYAASMVEAVDGAGMTASLTVSFVDTTDNAGQAVASTDVQHIASRLSARQPQHDDDTWRDVEIVPLADGDAVRTTGVEDVELPDRSGAVRSVVMQTILPVPGAERVAMVTLSSPSLGLVDEFLDLFDAVTSSFRLVAQPARGTAGTGPGR